MFEACEAFVWCLKDHFYAIYGHLKNKKKKKKKKIQKFQSGKVAKIFDDKKLPKKFDSTYLQISLVPCS